MLNSISSWLLRGASTFTSREDALCEMSGLQFEEPMVDIQF